MLCVRINVRNSAFSFPASGMQKDRVQYSSGPIDDLIAFLSKQGSWCIVYLIPETGHLQVSDEIPLLFDVKLNKLK